LSSFVPDFSTIKIAARYQTWRSVLVHKITPLHHLMFNGRLEIFKYVLEHVQNIDLNIEAEFGLTPLFFAILTQSHQLVNFLLSHGARTGAVYAPTRWSMLHVAAYLDNQSIVEDLLLHGADACAMSVTGLRPSIIALQNQKLHLIPILEKAEKSQCK